jgi:hypothetical protein
LDVLYWLGAGTAPHVVERVKERIHYVLSPAEQPAQALDVRLVGGCSSEVASARGKSAAKTSRTWWLDALALFLDGLVAT